MKRESEIFIIITILKWVRANEKYPETYVSRCYFLVGAGGFASRAAKNSPQGCFCAVFGDSAAAVLIHPLCPPENCAKQKVQRTFIR